jgi:hypothetical protein
MSTEPADRAVATAPGVATISPTPAWRRLLGFNLLTGIVLGVAGFYFG